MMDVLHALWSPKWLVAAVFVASAVYIHHRGRVRHGFMRQLTDHSSLMAPYNVIMYAFSKVPNTPFVGLEAFPELAPLQQNWQVIRDEAVALFGSGHIRAPTAHNDIGFHSFFKSGYKRFYVKWYDQPPPSALALCPRTTALVTSIPSVNAAMFAVLPPGGKLGAHRDPYAGSLRYHLGLVTPNNASCNIVVDGERYFWRDGEAVIFDETYIHAAENTSDVTRIIFFCDVERPLSPGIVAWFNRGFRNTVIRASQTENVPGEKIGLLNRIFSVVYRVRLFGKAVKARSRPAYYTLKWLLFGSVLVGICLL